jgi:hypothetical protein
LSKISLDCVTQKLGGDGAEVTLVWVGIDVLEIDSGKPP